MLSPLFCLPPPASTQTPAALFAADRFADAARAVATDASGRNIKIRALLRLDRWDEALGEAEDAVRLFPRDADLLGLLALAQFRGGQPDDALKSARGARLMDSESYFGLLAEATLLSQWQDDDKKALPLARRAAALRPDRPEGWWILLQTLDGPQDAPKVIAALRALHPKGHPFDEQVGDIGAMTDTIAALQRTRRRLTLSRDNRLPDMARIPMARAMDMIFVDTMVNGRSVRLLFDTGASNALVLDAPIAKKVHPTFLTNTIVRGVQGKEASRLLVARNVSLGPVRLGSLPMREVADTPMCDGIFGGALLERYAVTLDFGRGELLLRRVKGGKAVGTLPPIRGAAGPIRTYTVPFRRAFGGNLYVPLRLVAPPSAPDTFSVRSPAWAILDTGAQMGLISQRLAGALGAGLPPESVRSISTSAPVGLGSTSSKIELTLAQRPFSLLLGGGLVHPVAFGIGASPLDRVISPGTGFETGAILGIPFLSRYKRATFDYPNKVLILETDESPAIAPPDAQGQADPSHVPSSTVAEGKRWVFAGKTWALLPVGTTATGVRSAAPFDLAPGYISLRRPGEKPGAPESWWLLPPKSILLPSGVWEVR